MIGETLFLLILVLREQHAAAQTVTTGNTPCSTSSTYTITFSDTWTAARHPVNYPASAHFSVPVVAAHGQSYQMWAPATMASTGVKIVAEVGSTSTLRNELTQNNPGCSFATGSSVTLEVSEVCSRVSYITMIAPSPDWFTGFHDVELCRDGKWLDSLTIQGQPWDAGTDCGATYTSPNCQSNPTQGIFEITAQNSPSAGEFVSGDGDVLPVATITLERIVVNPTSTPAPTSESTSTTTPAPTPEPTSTSTSTSFKVVDSQSSSTSCNLEVTFEVTFTDLWTSDRHPVEYPRSAHFSPPVLAAHGASYSMWAEGMLASTGVKDVAEIGATREIRGELRTQNPGCNFRVSSVSDFSNGISLVTSEKCSLLSFITMIAPSPDWITGFNNLELCHDGKWVDRIVVETQPSDAGTDCGVTFTSGNCVESPQQVIARIPSNNTRQVFVKNGEILPVSMVSITLTGTDSNADDNNNDSKLSAGAIAGIAVAGGVVGVLILMLGMRLLCWGSASAETKTRLAISKSMSAKDVGTSLPQEVAV